MARQSSFAQETKPVTATRVWSGQQQNIFQWFEARKPIADPPATPIHLVVRARAGTGKTTTIIEGVNRAPESSILVCAFNKRIADELNTRITGAGEARTLHAVGYRAITAHWGRIAVASGTARADWLTNAVVPKETPAPIRRLISLIHTKGREMCPLQFGDKALTDLALFFDYVPDEGWSMWTLERCVTYAYDAMAYARDHEPTSAGGIDFADMIYLPLVHNILTPSYDLVVVDECQDMSAAQLTIAQRVSTGRICVIGDDRQAVYSWRGADSGSLDRLKRDLRAGELPLTLTYRCCQAVTRRAQGLVPDIIADPSNPEGVIDACTYDELLVQAQPGDFILSRLNAPLVALTLHLLKAGKRARMAGRDIGAGIQSVLRKLRVTAIGDLDALLDRWEAKTCARYAAYGQIALMDRCYDQADMIRSVAEGADNLSDLENRIAWLFSDDVEDGGQILCSSIHKAKGLEADRVFVLSESLYRRGTTPEEINLDYVATTRAKTHLTLVTGCPSLRKR
jgi:DNA helicase-2/ATP-dependent DNA helicase PcrA